MCIKKKQIKTQPLEIEYTRVRNINGQPNWVPKLENAEMNPQNRNMFRL